MGKFKIKKEKLIELYYINKLSFSEIAKIYNCSGQTICNKMKEYGLKARSYSESLKDKQITWSNKISKANTGKKRYGIGGREKGCKSWNIGLTKVSFPYKITYGVSGKNHWNWKGGISSIQIRLRQSSNYKEWRNNVFIRDNWICNKCKIKGGYLEAHHIISFSSILLKNNISSINEAINCQLLWNINNGLTLCKKCHKKTHRRRKNEKIK